MESACDGKAVIGVLEDDADRLMAMRATLESLRVEAVFCDNAPDMIRWLSGLPRGPLLLSLDHDLGPRRLQSGVEFEPGTGRDVADWLCARAPMCPVLVHSSNGLAAQGMVFALEAAGWTAERVIPMNDHAWIGEAWEARLRALIVPPAV